MMKEYPVGKAQQVILDALGRKASGATSADALFEELGIIVRSTRKGRASVPEVVVKRRMTGGFTEDGDGESWRAYDDLTAEQMQALAPWIVEVKA